MRKSAKRGEPQIFLLCVTLWASAGGVVSPRRVHHPRPRARKQKSAPPWPRHNGRGVGAFLFHSDSSIRETRPQKSRHTFITLACRLAVLRTEHRRRGEDLSPSLTVRQRLLSKKTARMGDKAKPLVFVGRRLCCVNSAFLCLKSHRAKPIRDHMPARLTSQGR